MRKNLKVFIDNHSGQVALVVLLIMIVMLTLGVSVVQRSLFDVRLSQAEEESNRAFQAAETGVEMALSNLSGASSVDLGDGLSYSVSVEGGGETGWVTGTSVGVGEIVSVSLDGASPNLNSLNVYFIDKANQDCDSNPAAIEVVVVREVGGGEQVARSVYDVENRDNGFTLLSKGDYVYQGTTFCGVAQVNLPGNSVEARIRVLYSSASVGVEPQPLGATLAEQLRTIRSEGSLESGVTRVVQVDRYNPQTPSIFDYVLYSGGALVK